MSCLLIGIQIGAFMETKMFLELPSIKRKCLFGKKNLKEYINIYN